MVARAPLWLSTGLPRLKLEPLLCIGLDWIEQGLTSPPTQYRLSGRHFLVLSRVCSVLMSTSACLKNTLRACESIFSERFSQMLQFFASQYKFICDDEFDSQYSAMHCIHITHVLTHWNWVQRITLRFKLLLFYKFGFFYFTAP